MDVDIFWGFFILVSIDFLRGFIGCFIFGCKGIGYIKGVKYIGYYR